MMKLMKIKRGGFTLIELLVVIAIISLLSSIVLASLTTARNKAKDAAIKEDLVGVRTSAALYYSDNGGSYGIYTLFGNEKTCPFLAGSGAVFYESNVFSTIQHVASLNGGSVGRCGSNNVSYAIGIPLATQDDAQTEFFCIDSAEQAKISSPAVVNDLIDINAGLFRCNPVFFVN